MVQFARASAAARMPSRPSPGFLDDIGICAFNEAAAHLSEIPSMCVKRAIMVSLLLPLLMAVAGRAQSTPTATVKTAVDEILQILGNESLDREARWEQIGYIIRQRFDVEEMAQSILATNWKRATPEEKTAFIDFFSQYLENTYRSKIEGYTNEQVKFGVERINGDRATVETSVATGSAEIPVVYKMLEKEGEWFAYDVVIEGVSLVANYRNTFAAIVKSEGMDGLLNNLQRDIAKYKSEQTSNQP